ncbi:MAG: outer membrane beta-barrel protein [Bacteroidales bacterium]
MKKQQFQYIILFLLLLLHTPALNAKELSFLLKGNVIEASSRKPLEGAAIRLLAAKDSVFIEGVVSDQKGNYQIRTHKSGAYLVQVTYLGFETQTRPIHFDSRQTTLTDVDFSLAEQTHQLSETVVKAKAPEVVIKQDTVEYNADSYKVREGSPVEEVLRKLPGVRIAADGAITIEGKPITEILVDGRPFFGNDQQLTLKNLPADLVQKIQVVDRKNKTDEATGVESEEKEKVINITIKPERKKGVFGNANAGYGSSNRYMLNAMINSFLGEDKAALLLSTSNLDLEPVLGNGRYAMGEPTRQNVALTMNKLVRKGFNIDGNLRFRHSTDKNENESFTENLLPDSSYFTNNSSMNQKMNRSVQAGFQVEYKKDSTFTFQLRPNFQYGYDLNRDESVNETLDGARKLVNSSVGSSQGSGKQLNYGLESFISKTLGKKGRVATLQLNWNETSSEGFSHRLSLNTFVRSAGDSIVRLDQEKKTHTTSSSLNVRASYSEPIGKNGALVFNYSISDSRSDNENNTYSLDTLGRYSVLDSLYSRSTLSGRLNQSAGLSYRARIKEVAFNFGVSLDPGRIDENTYVGTTTLKSQLQHQFNYSPRFSAFWNNKKGTFVAIRYFGRSNMPTARQLSPVVEVISPVAEIQGNPNLKNGFRHQLSGNWRYNNRESQFSLMVFSNFTLNQNNITNYTIYNPENGKRFTSYRNVNGDWSTSSTVMVSFPLRNKKYQCSANTNLSFSNRTGFTNGEENQSRNDRIGQTFSVSYSGDQLYATIEINAEYSGIQNSLQNLKPQNTVDYGSRFDLRWNLPWDISLGSAVIYRGKSGYAAGFNRQIVNWDADIRKEFLKNRQASVSFIVMDILGQNESSSRSISATSISDNRWNSLGRYGMLKFSYRFNFMKGKSGE